MAKLNVQRTSLWILVFVFFYKKKTKILLSSTSKNDLQLILFILVVCLVRFDFRLNNNALVSV